MKIDSFFPTKFDILVSHCDYNRSQLLDAITETTKYITCLNKYVDMYREFCRLQSLYFILNNKLYARKYRRLQ
jgi:hypothetical protein